MRTNPGGSTCSRNRQELIDRQCHQALLVLVSGIGPAKSDHTIRKGNESMVGNRYTMGVLAKITKRVLRAAERAFCVNHPFGPEQRTQPGGEGLRILQRGQCSVELEFVFRKYSPVYPRTISSTCCASGAPLMVPGSPPV